MVRQPRRYDGEDLTASERILKIRFRYPVLGIVRRLYPLMIDLRRYDCLQNRAVRVARLDLIGTIVGSNRQRQGLVMQRRILIGSEGRLQQYQAN